MLCLFPLLWSMSSMWFGIFLWISLVFMVFSYVFFLMIRRPPRSTRTDTLVPYTTLFRSVRFYRFDELLRGGPLARAGRLASGPMDSAALCAGAQPLWRVRDRKSTRLNSSH